MANGGPETSPPWATALLNWNKYLAAESAKMWRAMTDTATLDRPCAWYACLDQAATGRLFCAHHEPGAPPFEDDSVANHEPECYDDFLPEEAPD